MRYQWKVTLACCVAVAAAAYNPRAAVAATPRFCQSELYFEQYDCPETHNFFCYECNPGCVDGGEQLICGYTSGGANQCDDEPSCDY